MKSLLKPAWSVVRKTLARGSGFIAAIFSALLAFAYVPYQERVNGVPVPLRWADAAVAWRFYPTTGANVDVSGGVSVAAALADAFDAWPQTELNGVRVNVLAVTRGSDTAVSDPNISDCANVISFSPSSNVEFSTGVIAFSQMASVAVAPGQSGPPYTYDVCGGITSDLPAVFYDADMAFNPQFRFSTATPPLAGHFDVQFVASHEFGHMLGLDHNGMARTLMYPFGETGPNQPRQLAGDDAAGAAFLYPAEALWSTTGTISGRVLLRGSGVFASHIVAIDAATDAPVLDTLTNPDGTYQLVGVPPGTYHVIALPLTGPYTLENFLGWACGYAADPNSCIGYPENPLDYTGTFF